MSLYFHVTNFSDRVMVALTVMLVMASLQSSIQDSLPKTAYFKFIDWWILFVLNTQVCFFFFRKVVLEQYFSAFLNCKIILQNTVLLTGSKPHIVLYKGHYFAYLKSRNLSTFLSRSP